MAQVATCLAAAKPAVCILLGRSLSRIQPVIDTIKGISPDTQCHFVPIDLSSLESVRNSAAMVKKLTPKIDVLTPKIDVLLNNAGIMALHEYKTNNKGIELQFATNYVGPFLLTNPLLPLVLAGANPRIVNVSSAGHAIGDVRFDDVNFQNGKAYDEWQAYGQGNAHLYYLQGVWLPSSTGE